MPKRCLPRTLPWGDGEVPRSHQLDFLEPTHPVLGHPVARSFRAALVHKIEVIISAHGGYGAGGLRRAARALNVYIDTVSNFLHGRAVPTAAMSHRVDECYIESLEKLAEQHRGRVAKEKRRSRNEPTLEEELQSLVDARGL